MNQYRAFGLSLLLCLLEASSLLAQQSPSREEVLQGLRKATEFFSGSCSKHGGYVWRYSRDLRLSEGEAETGPDTIWVQPPGTPAVGQALLDAYRATGDQFYLNTAVGAARALVRGQLQSGGWNYRIEFDARERLKWGYRDNAAYRASRRKKNRRNITTLDDDTTPAASRFLSRIDKVLEFRDAPIHQASEFALKSLVIAQSHNGGWRQNWDNYPQSTGDASRNLKASYPLDWSRKWMNDWRGRYYTNDNVAGRMIETMLTAWTVYGRPEYLQSARRTGDFLILAQMPAEQPAWAQQYDDRMQPCWDRKFEPPSISGSESQAMLEALLSLYRETGDDKYLGPVPRALAYLKKSQLPDGRLARFYELRTNRPLFFTRDYQLTYDSDDSPTHYAFIVDSRLSRIEAEYQALKQYGKPAATLTGPADSSRLVGKVRRILQDLDERGAWIDKRGMRGFGKASPEGVVQSQTFNDNVRVLCRYLQQSS